MTKLTEAQRVSAEAVIAGRLSAMRLGVKVALRERENTVKKMITTAIGGALLTGSLLGAGLANAEMPPLPQAGEYSTCGEAAKDGVFNISEGDENYWDEGDRDGDGIACEKN